MDRANRALTHLAVAGIILVIVGIIWGLVQFGLVPLTEIISRQITTSKNVPTSQPVTYVPDTQVGIVVQPVKPSPSPNPSVKTTTPVVPANKLKLDVVPPAQPKTLAIPSIGVDADVRSIVMTMCKGVECLDPTEASSAYWWKQGATPSSSSKGTTFIVGHSCHSAACPAVFNHLQDIKVGATITVTTLTGTLTYVVNRTKSYPGTAGSKPVGPEVYENVPNRLVLVTCKLRSDGASQTDNFVVWAQLIGAKAS